MSRTGFVLAAASAALAGCPQIACAASSSPRKIMLIRHADKPDADAGGMNGDGTASSKSLQVLGWERAGALVRFFTSPTAPDIATPTAIFASGLTKTTDGALKAKSARPFETVTPLAAMLGIPIDTSFTTGDEAALAAAVLRTSGVVLVSWGHKHLAPIARAIPASDPGAIPDAWPGARFDMVWVFDLEPGGTRYSFRQVPEMLLAGDSAEPFPRATR
jgi:hypothetical protein